MSKLLKLSLLFLLAFTGRLDADEGSCILVEAESFRDKGGWVVDQQYMDQMGSPVLMAHGLGEPVGDATTETEIDKAGTYRVFVRTRNWAAPWTPDVAPGRFRLTLGSKRLETVFGTEGNAWHWQFGGTVDLPAGRLRLTLHDLTGFNGRADAILLASNPDFTPPESPEELDRFRRKLLGLTTDPNRAPEAKEGPFDLVVTGGGIAGICSAVSAARLGCKVALIQDRPVLGGNNSSEIRVHLQGRLGYEPYPNLGNLVHQLDPNQRGNARPAETYRDDQKLEIVRAEKNITLYLNTHVISCETEKAADGSLRINSVTGRNILSNEETKFPGKLFADCTGDANVGYLAGADWRMGRESRDETGESLAPGLPDNVTMGASVQWNTVTSKDDRGNPVKTPFPEVPWAYAFTHESARPSVHGDWDWETGLEDDQVREAEAIRDNGLRAVFGHWSYMKNQSDPYWRERVDTLKLGWVAFVAGKRESRRLMGDVVLSEHDLVEGKKYPDACVVTTWTIDLHHPHPQNRRYYRGEEFRTTAKHKGFAPYPVPYRCFYSRNVSNLFMAGRCVSVTRVALGSIRVMRTGGVMGEVVGMAASIAVKNDTTPRGVYENHLEELKKLMKKGAAPKPKAYRSSAEPKSAANPSDPEWLPKAGRNLAVDAVVSVSSTLKRRVVAPLSTKHINDGRFDIASNAGRWVSEPVEDMEREPQWVVLNFSAPATINAMRFASGQEGGAVPIRKAVLQKKDGNSWVDIPGSAVEFNVLPVVAVRFEPVTGEEFRFLVTQSPENMARLWELELYRVAD